MLTRSDEHEARRTHELTAAQRELAAAQRSSTRIQPQRRRNTTVIKALIKGVTRPSPRLQEAALLRNQTSMHVNNKTLIDLNKSLNKRGPARPHPQEAALEDADALQCKQTAQVLTYAHVCARMRTYADV